MLSVTISIVQLVMKQCRVVAPCITPPTLFLADPYCSANKGLSALSLFSIHDGAPSRLYFVKVSLSRLCEFRTRQVKTGSDPCEKRSPKKSRQVDVRFLSRCLRRLPRDFLSFAEGKLLNWKFQIFLKITNL